MASQVTAGRFVGRTQELARLHQLLTRAIDGQPLVALLGGEAGVGKTRLAEQLAATATQQGVRVLHGGCVPLGEEGLPFAPVIEALRGLADQLDPAELAAVAGPARPELARLLPDLAWGREAVVGPAVAGAGQGRLFELLLGLVQRLATGAPLLWVVEDLHWADRSTRDLLAFLATTLRSGRVMVVMKERPVPDRLAKLGLPVLVIFGSQDRRWQPSSAEDHRRVPQARIEILDVGHTPMFEDPDTTGALLRGFAVDTASR